jgi:hypothetical protein
MVLFQSAAQVREATQSQAATVISGVISATLVGEDASLIANGILSLRLIPPDPKTRVPRTLWTATTSAVGAFRFTGLPGGNYQLCSQAPATAWLSPCEWNPGPALLTLSNSQSTVSTTVTMKKGVIIPIRVDDPTGSLNQNEGKIPGAHLLLGTTNSVSSYRQATVVSSDASGRNYQILIPFGSTINIVAFSTYFSLVNSLGASVPRPGSTTRVLVHQGQAPPSLYFQVTGGGQ